MFAANKVCSPKHWLVHLVALHDEAVPRAVEDGLHLLGGDVRVLRHQHLRPASPSHLHHLQKRNGIAG